MKMALTYVVLPSWTKVPKPVGVKNAGMPAPPRHKKKQVSHNVLPSFPFGQLTSSDALCQSTLWSQLQQDLSRQVLALKFSILANVGGNDMADLSLFQQQAQTEVIYSTVVRYNSEVADFGLQQASNQVLRDATKAKTLSTEC